MLSQYDGLNTIGERDDDWEPLELDAIGGTASAAVEMINEQMRMDANPEDLPTDLVDSDVGAADVRTRFTVAEQLIKWTARMPVHVGTDLSIVGRQPASAEEVEQDEDYTSRQEAIAEHISYMIKKKILCKLKHASVCRPVCDRPVNGCPGPWHDTL